MFCLGGKNLIFVHSGANRLKSGLLRTGVTRVTHCACRVHSKNNFHIYVLFLYQTNFQL